MAKIDYAKTALKVQKVIEDNGSNVIFIRRSDTPTDPAKPWRTHSTDLSGTPPAAGSTSTGKAIRDEYDAEELADNQYVRHQNYKVLVSPKSLGDIDLSDFDAVELDGQVATINELETIKPAAVVLLYILHVER